MVNARCHSDCFLSYQNSQWMPKWWAVQLPLQICWRSSKASSGQNCLRGSQQKRLVNQTAELQKKVHRGEWQTGLWLVSLVINKIGPQWVLGVLCLNLFLSVGMLFSAISISELNCYKWKGRQVFTALSGKCMAEYCLFTLSLSLIIIEGFRARRAYMGNSMLQTLHSEGKFWN